MRILTTGSLTDSLRVVIVVFLVVLLQNLPLGQLPTLYDLYKAVVLAAIAAVTLYAGGSTGTLPGGYNQ